MAEELKSAQVPETAPVVETSVVAAPVEETTAAAPATEAVVVPEVATTEAAAEVPAPVEAATTEAKTEVVAETEATAAPVTTEEPAKTEEVKEEESKPIEEGNLDHKGIGFPLNLVYKKEFFSFGSEPVEAKALAHFVKHEKSSEYAQQTVAWAAHTGKGLLFVGGKTSPSFVFNLAEVSEPVVDGPHKFTFIAKGHKHTFKAPSIIIRDNWVAQIKAKSAEAKEIAESVKESEAYKAALESFKPAKVEEKAEEPVKEAETAASTEAAAATEEPAVVATEEPAKEAATEEAIVAPVEETTAAPVSEEAPKEGEEAVKEEAPKRRSMSRKRTSFLGFLKKDKKAEEEKANETVAENNEVKAEETEAPVVAPQEEAVQEEVVATEEAKPVAEENKDEEEAKVEEAASPEEKAVEAKEASSPREKFKRNTLFSFSFLKEKKPVEEKAPETETATSATAPVIPPVETSAPLDAAASSPEAPVAEAPAPVVDAAEKVEVKEVAKEKAERRKSSLPFAFGKKKPSSDDESEKPEKNGFSFSKIRSTIRGRKPATEKSEEQVSETVPEGVKEEAEPAEEKKGEAVPAETAAPAIVATEEAKPAEVAAVVVDESAKVEEEIKPEAVATAPVVAATA